MTTVAKPWLRLIGRIPFNFPINRVRTPFGEPFNAENHWVKTLAEYVAGQSHYRGSALAKYHAEFLPKSILDILTPAARARCDELTVLPLGEYPWGSWTSRRGSAWFGSRHCGPSANDLVKLEWESFINLFESIKVNGARFDEHGCLFGTLLFPTSAPPYCIMLGGNHRTAVMQYLGYSHVKVRLLARDYIGFPWQFESSLKTRIEKEVFTELISENFRYSDIWM